MSSLLIRKHYKYYWIVVKLSPGNLWKSHLLSVGDPAKRSTDLAGPVVTDASGDVFSLMYTSTLRVFQARS